MFESDTNSIQADELFQKHSVLIFYQDEDVVLNALNAINTELRTLQLHAPTAPFPEMYFSNLPPDDLIKASFSRMCVDQVVLEAFVKKYEQIFALQMPVSLVSIISLYAFKDNFTTQVIKHLDSQTSEIQVAAFETVNHLIIFLKRKYHR